LSEESVEFNSEEEYLDYIAHQYQVFLEEKRVLDAKLAKAVDIFDKFAGNDQKKTGAVHALGIKYDVVVTRKENVKYERNQGDPHPLFQLVKDYRKLLEDKVSLSIDEKGGQISKFLDDFEKNPALVSKEEKECCLAIMKSRLVTAGKPGIEIKIRKHAKEG
jgi:hypothetical protein